MLAQKALIDVGRIVGVHRPTGPRPTTVRSASSPDFRLLL
jgi:hypothetical protein